MFDFPQQSISLSHFSRGGTIPARVLDGHSVADTRALDARESWRMAILVSLHDYFASVDVSSNRRERPAADISGRDFALRGFGGNQCARDVAVSLD